MPCTACPCLLCVALASCLLHRCNSQQCLQPRAARCFTTFDHSLCTLWTAASYLAFGSCLAELCSLFMGVQQPVGTYSPLKDVHRMQHNSWTYRCRCCSLCRQLWAPPPEVGCEPLHVCNATSNADKAHLWVLLGLSTQNDPCALHQPLQHLRYMVWYGPSALAIYLWHGSAACFCFRAVVCALGLCRLCSQALNEVVAATAFPCAYLAQLALSSRWL